MAYNPYPSPMGGRGAFGMVPGLLGLPDPAADLGRRFPNLTGTNAALSSDIYSGLSGLLSPGTVNMLQDTNAAWAVGAGMPATTPGSLSTNRFARNLGLTSEQLKNTAIQQYNQTIPTISRTQTVSPELQTEIALQNALNLAAPDPAQAQSYAEKLFQKYLGGLMRGFGGVRSSGGGGGPAAGTRTASTGGGGYGPDIVANSLGTGMLYGGELRYGPETQPTYYSPSGGGGGYSIYEGASPGFDLESEFYDLATNPMGDTGMADTGYLYQDFGSV